MIVDNLGATLIKFLKQYPAVWITVLVLVLIYISLNLLPDHQPAPPDVPSPTDYCNYPTADQVGTGETPGSGIGTQTLNPGISFTWTCDGRFWVSRDGNGFHPYPSAAHQLCRFQSGDQVEYHTNAKDCASSHLLFMTMTPPDPNMQAAWYDVKTQTWYESGGSNVYLGSASCGHAPWLTIYVDSNPGQHGSFFAPGVKNCSGNRVSYHAAMAAINRYNLANPPGVLQTIGTSICRATYTPATCDTTING